jgi:pimeloyl-ACP methyl ester carboxylesterase
MPTVLVNNINFYYEVHGSGKPLTIINGLGVDVSEFGILAEDYTKSHKVLIFDNRGAGRSDKPDESYSIEQMASDTAGVMEKAGFNRSAVMGISMGGRIALELALSKPNMVSKLVLVSTSARVKRNWFRYLATRLPHFFKGKYPQPRYAYLRQRAASGSYNCSARLKEIKAPTLIAQGKNDKIAPIELANEMHQSIKGSRIKTFNGGHLFFLIRSRQQFSVAVNKFLNEN